MYLAYLNTALQGVLLLLVTGVRFRPVLNFMELHALTLAAHSYALLDTGIPLAFYGQVTDCVIVHPFWGWSFCT